MDCLACPPPPYTQGFVDALGDLNVSAWLSAPVAAALVQRAAAVDGDVLDARGGVPGAASVDYNAFVHAVRQGMNFIPVRRGPGRTRLAEAGLVATAVGAPYAASELSSREAASADLEMYRRFRTLPGEALQPQWDGTFSSSRAIRASRGGWDPAGHVAPSLGYYGSGGGAPSVGGSAAGSVAASTRSQAAALSVSARVIHPLPYPGQEYVESMRSKVPNEELFPVVDGWSPYAHVPPAALRTDNFTEAKAALMARHALPHATYRQLMEPRVAYSVPLHATFARKMGPWLAQAAAAGPP